MHFFHSVMLDSDKCMGCTHCVKNCPTEAIRVRDGKARITSERCIDCGACIRVCPHHAKLPIYDPLEVIGQYRYKIALPAPALYAQFNHLDSVDLVIGALRLYGFDEVFEVARAAEIVSESTRQLMRSGKLATPVISSACPVVTRLIRVRFPELIDKILPLHAPIEVAARLAKEDAARRTGLPPEEIGAIFISPCPAKVTAVKMPLGTRRSAVDAVVAVKDIYPPLLQHMKRAPHDEGQITSGKIGIGWASSGGEAVALMRERYLAADGIQNVIKVLEEIEDEKFTDLDFVELCACSAGCVGGVLNVENPYIARAKLEHLRRTRPLSCNQVAAIPPEALFDDAIEYLPVMELDSDISVAMEMLQKINEIESRLHGMDCGSCGSPSCRALAEDIVKGLASEDFCIYNLRDQVKQLGDQVAELKKEKEVAAR